MTTIQERFEEFHTTNPHIYDEIVEMARQWKKIGRKQLGIKMFFEALRWNTAIATKSQDFKLNDHYTSRYVRLIQEQESDLKDVFRTRTLRTQ
jgi:hypothetical protein